jgi:MOSC domain-containing protein YiiM
VSDPTATLVSVQAGRVRTHTVPGIAGHDEREWRTGYFKDPVAGPVRVGRLGVVGDEQFDLSVHGGPDRAVLAYSADHYPRWREELGIAEMGPGAFAENFTVSGLDESTVCLGDTYAVGTTRLQVSQPRGPCANIARRWQRPELVKRVADSTRFGWYLRVLEEGDVAAGMPVTRISRPYPEFDVARVFELRMRPALDVAAVERLARLPELSGRLQEKFATWLAGPRAS